MSRTDALKAAFAELLEANRAQIEAAGDLRRAECILLFDEHTGAALDEIFRTESRRRRSRPQTNRAKLSAVAPRLDARDPTE